MTDPFLDRLRRALAPEFDVERELASGGMGTVYLGREVALDRRVAIKVLRPELATERAVERFVREARTLAGFHHPHIVAVHRVIDADGISCYTMDYLEGQTLADRLAAGPLPAADVVRLGRDLLDALGAAHRRGVVHRDIKPSNIILGQHGAILTDFGIAKSLTGEHAALTAPGQPIGTLLYMPPEQAAGKDVTPATDLYALAMVLYEAATGRPWSIMDRVDAADWSGVPRPLASALRRALAWAPEDRWPDAPAFERALWAPRVAPATLAAGLAALALLVLLTGRLIRNRTGPGRAVAPIPDLAIQGFDVTGPGDPSLGADIASVTWMNLEPFGRISLVPLDRGLRGGLPASVAGYRASGSVTRRRETLTVRLVVQDSFGVIAGGDEIVGNAANKWELGAAIAFKLVEVLRPELVRSYGRIPPPTRNVKALDEYLNGQEAFREDRWREAELHLAQAAQLDPNFALARWRLWNVQLWRRIARTVDLEWILSHGEQLTDVDRRLIEAELAPPGAARLRKYEDARARHPDDDYATLLYASELYHRGPLSGVGIDSSTVILRDLTAKPVAFAPAHDQLVWALIRLGDQAAARRALDRLEATAKPGRDIDPLELEFAWQARFGSPGGSLPLDRMSPKLAAGLLDHARLALSFDVPETELQVGALITRTPQLPDVRRADGHEAMGLALVALGRPAAALPHFDSAAALFGTPRAALQAAQWRVIPGALGFPGAPAVEVERGRRALQEIADRRRDAVAGSAAWTLAVDALTRDDAAAARRWRARVRETGLRRLDLMLQGLETARSGDFRRALTLTAPLDEYEDWRRLGDAFDRAVLHFSRARWQDTLGLHLAADTTRLWQENSDFDGWLNGEVQAAEVDWTLGLHARRRLGLDALARGETARGCLQLRRVLAIWSDAEATFAPLVSDARRAAARCPP